MRCSNRWMQVIATDELESMEAEDEAHGTFGLSEQSLEPENELEQAS